MNPETNRFENLQTTKDLTEALEKPRQSILPGQFPQYLKDAVDRYVQEERKRYQQHVAAIAMEELCPRMQAEEAAHVIASMFGVSTRTIFYRAKAEGWRGLRSQQKEKDANRS